MSIGLISAQPGIMKLEGSLVFWERYFVLKKKGLYWYREQHGEASCCECCALPMCHNFCKLISYVYAHAHCLCLIDLHMQLRGTVILTSASGVEGVGSTDIRLKNVRAVSYTAFQIAHSQIPSRYLCTAQTARPFWTRRPPPLRFLPFLRC